MNPERQIEAMKPAEKLRRKAQTPRLKGFGYLYQRGTTWWIRYSVRGRDFRESSHSEQEGVAQKLLKARWQELGRGRFIGPSQERVIMDDLFTSLENDYAVNGRRSLGTLKGRLAHICARRLETVALLM